MQDVKYCYLNSNVLKNKLNILNQEELFEAEKKLTFLRLRYLQENPITGNFDFDHLCRIHKYIFQDVYEWAGEIRTVEIGKGNLFCLTNYIQNYADTIFGKYFQQCYNAKDNFEDFIRVFSDNYGDLNALHPFREGNGRAQREFARLICLECGYDFNLSKTTHQDMLEASILSFDKADNSLLRNIFSTAVTPHNSNLLNPSSLNILTSDDLVIQLSNDYDYYDASDKNNISIYSEIYKAKISKMDAEKRISDARELLKNNLYYEQDYEDKNVTSPLDD